MNNPYLLRVLPMGPIMVGQLVQAISPELIDTKVDPDRFSLREAVAHLADWEPINLDRMKIALTGKDVPIPGIDESDRADQQGYGTWDVKEQILSFTARRAESIAFLTSLKPDQWSATVVHSEKGKMTICDQANMMVAHDMYHLEHLARYLAEGK